MIFILRSASYLPPSYLPSLPAGPRASEIKWRSKWTPQDPSGGSRTPNGWQEQSFPGAKWSGLCLLSWHVRRRVRGWIAAGGGEWGALVYCFSPPFQSLYTYLPFSFIPFISFLPSRPPYSLSLALSFTHAYNMHTHKHRHTHMHRHLTCNSYSTQLIILVGNDSIYFGDGE